MSSYQERQKIDRPFPLYLLFDQVDPSLIASMEYLRKKIETAKLHTFKNNVNVGDSSPSCPNANLTSSLGSHKGDAMEVSLDLIQFRLVQLFKITFQIAQIMRSKKRFF